MHVSAFIKPGRLRGGVGAVSSKSHAHRAVIAAALCAGKTAIEGEFSSGDLRATIRCLEALGAGFEYTQEGIRVSPAGPRAENGAPILDCGESGSTLRFLLPLAARLDCGAVFSGSGRLPERPVGELISCLRERGAVFSGGRLPFSVRGPLSPGRFELPGGVSSQYVSGLLIALPLLEGDSEIILSSPLQSVGYVDLTVHALSAFGVASRSLGKAGFLVPGGQKYISPGNLAVGGDWSSAAFFLAAGAFGGPVRVYGLERDCLQRDRLVVELLERFGARARWDGDGVTLSGAPLSGTEIDAADIPDLVPVLAAVAAGARGRTVFYNAGRLRGKESDRLRGTAALLSALGGEARAEGGRLVVQGTGGLRGGTADSLGDHRLAMTAAICAGICGTGVEILRPMCVSKSYPAFYRHFKELGGEVYGVGLG